MGKFEPFDHGRANRSADGKTVTGTFAVRPGYRLVSFEVHDEVFVTCVFEVEEFYCEICHSNTHDALGHGSS